MEKSKIVVSPNDINPVDFYNQNCVEDAFDFMESITPIERNSPTTLTYVRNASDKRTKMIVFDGTHFEFKHENGLLIDVGTKFTPFALVQKLKFKGNFKLMLHYVTYHKMNNPIDYIRVGIKYYKKTIKKDVNGIRRHEIKLWDKPTIVADHGKDYIDRIPIYDDFTMEPNNVDYEEIVDNNYNLYAPFEHKPMSDDEYVGEIQWYWTNTLLEHIFGEQYELGLQYMATLYTLPKQKLPILVLVSEERSTGKTTFVDWIDILFGANTVIINPQDISNNHNSSYTDKNIIMIEESKFEHTGALEKLKNLSTQKKILVNPKFVQQYSMPFHGKLIITSNDENKFSKIDDTEIRYWIRKIPTLKGKANHNILTDMKNEIPAFLHYLSKMPPIDTSKSRMVFTPEVLNTKALETVKKESRTFLYKDLEILMDDWFMQNPRAKFLKFTLSDIKERWFAANHKVDRPFLKQVLRDEFKKTPKDMQRFVPFNTGKPNMTPQKRPGRPYVFKNPYYDASLKNKPETL
jgi:hypothetical protein